MIKNLILPIGVRKINKMLEVNLTENPHLLIVGGAGTGKTSFIKQTMDFLIKNYTEDELKFLLIDPKGNDLNKEYSKYDNSKYLIKPRIETAQCVPDIIWLRNEMNARFDKLASVQCRNILEYNEKSGATMPYIVCIIDELSDVISSVGSEVEPPLIGILQMGRAVGIQFILASQIVDEKALPIMILANLTRRLAFFLLLEEESKYILGADDACKLEMPGDIIYFGPEFENLIKVRTTYIVDSE